MNERVLKSSKDPEIAFESTAVPVERPNGGRYPIYSERQSVVARKQE